MQTRQQSLDLRISFMLRRTYTDKDGKHPIILRISYRAEQRDTFTGFFIENKYWLPRVGRVMPEEPNSSNLNKKLQKLTQEVSEHFDEFRYSRLEFSIDAEADGARSIPGTPGNACSMIALVAHGRSK